MKRSEWRKLGPGVLLGAGIVAATRLAALTADAPWLVLSGPLLLACAALSADLWAARLLGLPPRPSVAALIMAGTFIAMGLLLTQHDPRQVQAMLPIVGAASWVALQREPQRRRCRWL